MAIYLNTNINLENYKELYNEYFGFTNSEVLAVAICYDFKSKEHSCKIEKIQ